MKIKSIAPWFGGKRNLAPVIVELIGKHRVYWELFCGSMAVLLRKPTCEMETVNDLHGDIVNLAKVIQSKELGLKLYEKLYRTLYAEGLFRESKERWISTPDITLKPDIDRAFDFFVVSWMGINGFAGTKRANYQFALRWCSGGGQGARRWRSAVESMPAWHKRLQNVVIMKRDAFEVISKIKDESDTVIYCDPPYFIKSSKYVHDFEDAEHGQLAELLARFKKARVIVSYYEHPKLEELYKGWARAYVGETNNSLRNVTARKNIGSPPKKEVILANWEPDGMLFKI